MSLERETFSLELPRRDDDISEWSKQFDGLCQNDGDVYPSDFELRGDGLGGVFLARFSGRRFFVEVTDYGWHSDNHDCEEGEVPNGYNLVSTTLVDLDKGELVFEGSADEHDEGDRFQGLADAVATAITQEHTYPTGFWSYALEVMTHEWGVFDD